MQAIKWMKNHKRITLGAVAAIILVNTVSSAVDAANKETTIITAPASVPTPVAVPTPTVVIEEDEEETSAPVDGSPQQNAGFCVELGNVLLDSDLPDLMDEYGAAAGNLEVMNTTRLGNELATVAGDVASEMTEVDRPSDLDRAIKVTGKELQDSLAGLGRGSLRPWNSDDLDDMVDRTDRFTNAMDEFSSACAVLITNT